MLNTVPGYRITDVLFEAEHFDIYRAVRESDHTSVLLKQLSSPSPSSVLQARFLCEFEIACKFNHPHISSYLAALGLGQETPGAVQTPDSSSSPVLTCKPTLVLEDQQGVDLLTYLTSCGNQRVSLAEFLDLAIPLAEALQEIHRQQVIHKNLCPGNIWVTPETGRVQITNFGMASLLPREQPVLQPVDQLEGELAYLAPEQTGRMNRSVDYRADLYALGCVFYHLLAGHPPFQTLSPQSCVHAHLSRIPRKVGALRDDLPAVVSAMVAKLLMKHAEDRYQSAHGLKRDLEKVKLALSNPQETLDFALGLEDIADRFQVPQKLYGRDNEVRLLLRRFLQAAGGHPKLLAIAGSSGIGKSAVVHEIHKPIGAYQGVFCAGKFDAYQKNVPYSSLQTALNRWIQHLLSLDKEAQAACKAGLLKALGAQARVLIDFMADFVWILGELPAVPVLGADETQNRFHWVMQVFLQEVTHDCPMVLFIDDLQWADRGTLSLLPHLLRAERCRLLVIVAYRDNEVDVHHPAWQTLQDLIQSPVTARAVSTLSLGPLNDNDVARLLADALHRSLEDVMPLVSLVSSKTEGNPLFIGEFLKTLYAEHLLDFEPATGGWQWQIKAIEARNFPSSVVALLSSKMAMLPESAQAMIRLAACVGSHFSLEMLAKMTDRSLVEVTRCLWPALRDGLLLQDGGDWSLGMVQPPRDWVAREEAGYMPVSALSPHCRFLHDRMLQAVYESMTPDARHQLHLRIGRFWLKYRTIEELSDVECFAVAEQFNYARHLIHDVREKRQLMRLNLRAAQRARRATVWELAATYCETGMALLPADPWQTERETTQALYAIRAEAENLLGHTAVADEYYDTLFARVSDPCLQADLCATRLVHAIGRGEWAAGMRYGQQGLAFLGMPLPDDTKLAVALAKERELFYQSAPHGVIEAVLDLPDMTDPALLVAMRLWPNLSVISDILGREMLRDYCIARGGNLILHHGKSDLAAMLLMCHAINLRREFRLQAAVTQAIQAKALADSYAQGREITNCYNLLGGMIWYLHAPFADCIALHRQGMQRGLENGEVARATMNYSNTLFAAFSQGELLVNLQREALLVEAFVDKHAVFSPLPVIARQLTKALIEAPARALHALDDDLFSADMLARIQPSFHMVYWLHYRMQLVYWGGDRHQALMLARQVEARRASAPLSCFLVDHDFFYGLLLLTKGEADTAENRQAWEGCEQRLKAMAELYPPNFEHKQKLLQAARQQREGAGIDAVCRSYREAIASAREHGFVQFQALGCELLSDYLQSRGFNEPAEPYLRQALYLYRRWGCTLKVRHLLRKNERFLARYENRMQPASSLTESHTTAQAQTLDMASVVKSAQLISSELQLERLTAKVLEVIVECAGATAAALLMNIEDHPYIVAQVSNDQPLTVLAEPALLDASHGIPVNLVRYVLNSREPVNIGDVV